MKNKIISVPLLLLLIISAARFYIERDTNFSMSSLNLTLITSIIGIVLFLINVVKQEKFSLLRNNLLSIGVLFVLGFYIVHFFEYLGYSLHLKETIKDMQLYNHNNINSAAICSLSCLLAFLISYIGFPAHPFTKYNSDRTITVSRTRILDIFQIVFLFSFYYFTDKRYFMTGGIGLFSNVLGFSLTSYMSQTFFIAVTLSQSVLRLYTKRVSSFHQYASSYSIAYYLCVLVFILFMLLSGDRGPIMYIILAYGCVYYCKIKKGVGLFKGIVILVLAAYVMNFLGFLRATEGDLSAQKIEQVQKRLNEDYSNEKSLIFSSTTELSYVVRAYHLIYDYTETNGTVYGLSFLNNLLGIIPGIRPLIIYPILGISEADARSVDTAYLSTRLLGSDHGMGTTCVADSYFNFGFVGSLILFFSFGILMRRLDVSIYSNHSGVVVMSFAICFLCFSVYLGRSSFFSPLNLSVYTSIITYLIMHK
ncbi:MAG: O-antigen polysaccharide polymerase Wzy [Aeriscardovia sp.]|nr:O-antigen polysaccharide polymerase Wzy [Aeriscardovia sp.]